MTTSTADLRYGRRGGRWAPQPAAAPARPAKPRTVGTYDWRHRSHPDVIADDRARQRGGAPDPADHAEVWAGRARMASARRAAGVHLDEADRLALDLQEQNR